MKMRVNSLINESLFQVNNIFLRNKLSPFVRRAFNLLSPGVSYAHNWHIDCMCEYLEACYKREIKRLIINIPPRSLKSITCSGAFPAWALGKDPMLNFMCISNSKSLIARNSDWVKSLIKEEWYGAVFPNTKIRKGCDEKIDWSTSLRGDFRAFTSNAKGVTGHGANFIICDDYMSSDIARSDKERQNVLSSFTNKISTRLNNVNEDVIIIIEQRLHENDLTGYLLEKDLGYEHCKLPIEERDDKIISIGNFKIERKRGDLLHEELISKPLVEKIKKNLGAKSFAEQYLQEPRPDEGNIFKIPWFKRYNERQEFDYIVQSWDTAIKAEELSDFTVCTTWGVKKVNDVSNSYLIDVYKNKLEYPELKKSVVSLYSQYNPQHILIEDKGSGQQLLQEMRYVQPICYKLKGIKPKVDKITRASSCTSSIEGGYVYLPKFISWLSDFENELAMFPNSKNDDQVDSVSQFLNWLTNQYVELQPRIRQL